MTPNTQTSQSLVATDGERTVAFKPFGEAEGIKLTVKVIQHFICKPTKLGRTCSERDAINFAMRCKAMLLNPYNNDCYLVGYDRSNGEGADFTMIIAANVYHKRAEANPAYDGIESGVIIKRRVKPEETAEWETIQGDLYDIDTHTLIGGWAKVYRKDRAKPFLQRLDLKKFIKQTDFWGRDPAGMIVKTAESQALAQAFPTTTGGFDGPLIDIESSVQTSQVASSLLNALPSPTPPQSQPAGNAEAPRASVTSEPATAATGKTNTTEGEQTPQARLKAIITAAGITFDQFRQWCNAEEQLTDALSLEDWAMIPTVEAKRLLTASPKIIPAVKCMFGGAR